MELDRLDTLGLSRLEAALRRHEPVRLSRAAPCRWPLDEIVPLCHAVADPALARWLPPPAVGRPDLAVTAIIPTHRRAPLGLDALSGQDVTIKLLILANGPYQGGVRVPWEGHGRTRQRGVELADTPYVLLTVDDAIPLGAGFVRTLIEALEDGSYDAVYARQIPWPCADPVTRRRLRAWTPPGEHHQRSDRHDHVAALYRRATLLNDPLDAVPIAEDWHWARRHRIGYVPTAPVLHSHPRHFRELYQRNRDIHRELIRAGEAPTVPTTRALLRALPGTLGRDLPGALGELLGQWAAAR